MGVATLCGSHHSDSTNAVALAMIADRLADGDVSADAIDVSVDVPAFRPEAVDDPPPTVRAVREAFEHADAVVFAVPEYGGGMAGWVKNILDWMVASGSLYERPVAVVSAATQGGAHAIEQLTRTLIWQGAFVVATCGIAAPLTIVRDGAVTDADALARLHRASDALLAVIRGELDAAALTSDVLESLGIDPLDRFS